MNVVVAAFGAPGFLHPALFAGRALAAAGHDVLLVSGPDAATDAADAGLTRYPRPGGDGPVFAVQTWGHPAAVELQRRHVLAAAEEHRADVVVASVLALGPLLAAENLDLPVVVLGQLAHLWPADDAALATADADGGEQGWHYRDAGRIWADARAALGYRPRGWTVATFPLMGDRLLLRGCPLLEADAGRLPDRVGFAGACAWEPPGGDPAANAWLDGRPDGEPVVYARLGRTFGKRGPLPWLGDALEKAGASAVLDLQRHDAWSAEDERRLAGRVHVCAGRWVGAIAGRTDAVVGSGTSTLAHAGLLAGVPVLATRGGGEQDVVTTALSRHGACRVLPPDGGRPEELAEVLADPGAREASARLGAAVRSVDGAAEIAAAVDEVTTGRLSSPVSATSPAGAR